MDNMDETLLPKLIQARENLTYKRARLIVQERRYQALAGRPVVNPALVQRRLAYIDQAARDVFNQEEEIEEMVYQLSTLPMIVVGDIFGIEEVLQLKRTTFWNGIIRIICEGKQREDLSRLAFRASIPIMDDV